MCNKLIFASNLILDIYSALCCNPFHIYSIDTQLRKLHASLESLVAQRRDLVTNTAQFAKSCALLSNAEEHTGLSRALSHLAEVEEKVEQVHVEQANGDFFQLSETIRDYVALLGAVKVQFSGTLVRLPLCVFI